MHLPEGGLIEGVLPLRSDDAYNDYIYPAVQWGHTGEIGAGFVGQATAGGHVIANGSALDGEYIFGDFALSGRLFHTSFAAMQDAITSLDPNDPQRNGPEKLTQAPIGQLQILFDHDNDPTTPSLLHTTMKDIIDDEPSYDGSGRADLRFGEGVNGELYILNKRNGWIYLAVSTLPEEIDSEDNLLLYLPLIR